MKTNRTLNLGGDKMGNIKILFDVTAADILDGRKSKAFLQYAETKSFPPNTTFKEIEHFTEELTKQIEAKHQVVTDMIAIKITLKNDGENGFKYLPNY